MARAVPASTVFAHAGDADARRGRRRQRVDRRHARARRVGVPGGARGHLRNRGFAHANNRGAATCAARYVLFLNPDTEIVDGTFGELVAALDARPGRRARRRAAGHRRRQPCGRRSATSRASGARSARRSAPSAGRVRPRWAGERELDMTRYEQEVECDWTSGSFMIAGREALLSAGLLDERFFIYSEEPDLCLRMKRAGWGVRHLPQMTIVHHAGKGGRAAEDDRPGRLRAPAVRRKALRGAPSRASTWPPSARGTCCVPRPGGGPDAAARRERRAARAAHARRERPAAVRRPAGHRGRGHARRLGAA